MKTKTLPRLFTKKNVPSFFLHKKKDSFTNMKGGDFQSADGFYRVVNRDESNDLVQHRYKKNNIDVTITGLYEDVYSILHVLEQTQPVKKTDFTEFFGNNNYSVSDSVQNNLLTPSNDTDNNISYECTRRDDKHIYAKDTKTGKKYSGSGILLIVKNKDDIKHPDGYFVLFNSSSNNRYDDLGGKLDTQFVDNNNILLENAKKEAQEESIDLFNFNSNSDKFIDIKSNRDNTYYRVYIYKVEDTNKKIQTLIEKYNNQYRTNRNTKPDYYETDRLGLFDYNLFKRRLDSKYNIDNITYGVFQTHNLDNVTVNGRCMKVIKELFKKPSVLSSLQFKEIAIDTSTIPIII